MCRVEALAGPTEGQRASSRLPPNEKLGRFEDDHVARHVGDEDTPEAEIARRVDQPRHGGQGQQQCDHEPAIDRRGGWHRGGRASPGAAVFGVYAPTGALQTARFDPSDTCRSAKETGAFRVLSASLSRGTEGSR